MVLALHFIAMSCRSLVMVVVVVVIVIVIIMSIWRSSLPNHIKLWKQDEDCTSVKVRAHSSQQVQHLIMLKTTLGMQAPYVESKQHTVKY